VIDMVDPENVPSLRQVVLDCTDAASLADGVPHSSQPHRLLAGPLVRYWS
jgi:hypothetical protein